MNPFTKFTKGEKMAIILDGKKLSQEIRKKIKEEIDLLKEKVGRKPKLAVILVGNDPASKIYVKNKEKACESVGIEALNFHKPSNLTQKELEDLVLKLNRREDVDGILIQLPLPEGLDCRRVINLVDPDKDVDGFHPVNVGNCLIGAYEEELMPCTPAGVIRMLSEYKIDLKGKNAVMVGASNIVGKPLSCMMVNAGATVCTCHIYTDDVKSYTSRADIICVATGVPHLIKPDMVKRGAVVIDIGISRVNGKIVGDVDFNGVIDKVSAITPVPGGVGPMTITMLLLNTLKAYKKRNTLT